MWTSLSFRAAALAAVLASCTAAGGDEQRQQQRPTSATPTGAERLRDAYPDHVAQVTATEVVLRNGRRLRISDGIVDKTPGQRLSNPDIDDMFAVPYVAGPPAGPPTDDPGRARFEPLFDAIYGDCRRGEVTPRLRPVRWMPSRGGGSITVTTVNDVAGRLEAVVAELERLPASMTRYLVPSAGTYNCRPIAGTDRRSMHTHGVAVDISTAQTDYWRWAGGEGARYRNRIPWEIVEIFERHGFIWGGKWAHFDTMHFEDRPELLPPRS